MTGDSLPVDEVLSELLAVLHVHDCAVLRAPTGSGKTTRVPPFLLDAQASRGRKIVVVEPRRIAARAAARYVSGERGQRCGVDIGYHVRFDACTSRNTKLIYVTPGILLQRLHSEPFLDDVGVVIFDEFHERGLESDLSLGHCHLIQQTVRPDLKLLAMSATLAANQVAEYLGNCAVVTSEGRLHPVEIRYEARAPTMSWPQAAADAVKRLLIVTPGDILVFLPGWAEIRQTARLLEPLAAQRNLAVLPLHGDLSPAEQDRALGQLKQRKVVLATNVAETSITVDGVTGVVDTGLARQIGFDAGVELDRLQIVPISQASADQRAGRAGRTQPGMCIRLWDQKSHRTRPEHTLPEVHRVDLSGAVLHLLALGEADVGHFPWPESPPDESIQRAINVLEMLGGTHRGTLTELGKQLARLPVHPRLGRLMIECSRHGHPRPAALAASLLAERDPFRKLTTRERPPSDSDLLDRMEILHTFEHDGRWETSLGELDRGNARYILRGRDQLERMIRDSVTAVEPNCPADEALMRSILSAFPDRVCRRRNPGGRKGVMVGGRGVRLDNSSAVTRSTLFIAVELDAGREESLVRLASAVERDWLEPANVTEAVETEFDTSTGQLKAWRRIRYRDLLLEETETALPGDADVSSVLLEAAMAKLDRVLPAADSPAGLFRTRVRCLRNWRPELNLPALDESDIRELLTFIVPTCRSLTDIHNADWLGLFRSRLNHQQLQEVDRNVPERVPTPSGRSFSLNYEEGRSPTLSVRIQDLFGMTETPRIAGGRVPILLHLLAPNNRPQQVTDDLASFWRNTYPVVRKELRARYPKHAWPEDPFAK